MVSEKLKEIINSNDTNAGKIFDIFTQLIIIISLITFSIETLPDLDPKIYKLLHIIEIISIYIFSAEYLLRLWAADRKFRFTFSFYGLIDICAIIPFYISTGLDLRAIRIFRLFRIIRIFKLLRFSTAIQRFKIAFSSIKAELALFFMATVFILYTSAVGIYFFESQVQPEQFKSIFHSLWWAVVTLTTVGYGDIFPITIGGRIFTFFVLIAGLGVVAVPTGLLSSALSNSFQEVNKRNDGND